MQITDISLSRAVDAKHLKIIITEAYDSFTTIQHIRAEFSRGSR